MVPADSIGTTQSLPTNTRGGELGDGRSTLALVLVWSRDEIDRVGELVVPPQGGRKLRFSIGRAQEPDSGVFPLSFSRLRPHEAEQTGPLRSSHVSRRQIGVRVRDEETLVVERLAKAQMRVNGRPADRADVRSGDLIEVEQRFILLCTRRPLSWPQHRLDQLGPRFAFATPDGDGFVGESPEAWAMRARIAMVARSDEHALIHGPSGSGKELTAQAIHRRSLRASKPLVARNAATFPEALIDAELFGNMKNFPNPGMHEREGLFGAANDSTLFLDELGDLPLLLQAHLLRVLDNGEYQRLGESRMRRANVRLLGATNRELTSLRRDLLARFSHRIELVGLDARREDIPLLALHLLREMAAKDPNLTERFFAEGQPRISTSLMVALLRHDYSAHTRELRELLWRAVASSSGSTLDWAGEEAEAVEEVEEVEASVNPSTLTRAQVVEALERCDGVRERAWRQLGLRSRHQLKRLLRKFEID